jgi:hypothetical protein
MVPKIFIDINTHNFYRNLTKDRVNTIKKYKNFYKAGNLENLKV